MVVHWDEVGNGSFQQISIVLTPDFQQKFYAFFSSKSICYDISEVEAIGKRMVIFLRRVALVPQLWVAFIDCINQLNKLFTANIV